MAAFRAYLVVIFLCIFGYTAVVAFFGGGLFLSVYLPIASFDAAGDARVLLLGKGRAA